MGRAAFTTELLQCSAGNFPQQFQSPRSLLCVLQQHRAQSGRVTASVAFPKLLQAAWRQGLRVWVLK